MKDLHDFTDETLAIISDEKSSNNEFQYVSYSLQKYDHLIKLFIICCADWYFIYCYVPFKATNNDADFFKNILETDANMKELVQPAEKTYLF